MKNQFGNFTGAGLKTGGTCSGFRPVYRGADVVSVPETGTLQCLTCYGSAKEPAVPGTRCEGVSEGTYVPDFTRAGEWVCDP